LTAAKWIGERLFFEFIISLKINLCGFAHI